MSRFTFGSLLFAVAGSVPAHAVADDTRSTPAADAAPVVEAIEVVGRRQGGGYEAGQVDGTKSSLPLLELPQSVRVLSRQALDDLGAVRLDEVLDYVGGVSRQNNFGGLWDNIAIRGLAGNENTGMAMLLNGLAGNRGFNAPRDLADIERVEFLKGPVAALYGASEPGGTVNLVTKKPLWQRASSLEAYAGSWDAYRTALDTTGPLGERFAYRLNLAAEDKGSFRDHVHSERQVVAPAFTWLLTPDSSLEYSGQWLRHATPLDRGVQAIAGKLGQVPRTRFSGEPDDGDVTVQNQTHQLVLRHDLASGWQARAALSWRQTRLDGVSTEPSRVLDDGRTLWRQRRDRDYRSNDFALQAELQGKLELAGLQHEVLAGVDSYRFRLDQRMLRVNPSADAPYAIDLLDPVYGQTPPTPLPNTDTHEHQRGTALTLQDAVTLAPAWRLLLGARTETVEQSLHNRRTGTTTKQDPTETSPRAGLSWLPAPGWAVFANAGRSFRPNPGSDADGQAFEPEIGRAYELGTKWESADKRLGATLAVFDIAKRNVVYNNGSGNSAAAGEVSSRGVELDIAGQLGTNWRLTGSLAWYDTQVERDSTLEIGSRLLGVPRLNAGVLAVYEAQAPVGGRYGVGGGLTHVGERVGQAYTAAEADAGTEAFMLPSYTTAKLVAYWAATPSLRLSLDVDNLFDKTYYTSSYSRVWVTPGAPRNVTLGVQAKF
ncbi:TonB-dependent siderophore receptor [Rubrivivax gelatinosus]|uniref:Iron complex outermembrane receptor protein n=1 Tax=Rubrivivax gelatinosus TaxID=28068 RepID=A0A4R2M8E2_RUBGE|nr:TonB-dependent siderophore receptor [Rubrivivax gelatinosus]MBK1687173.1 TonB-dependent siderophore receptor [Rubrivivax gelatinosus]TCP00687.1 iron complex outermembrane receptor protein [Rubrivivax gelatinosus]